MRNSSGRWLVVMAAGCMLLAGASVSQATVFTLDQGIQTVDQGQTADFIASIAWQPGDPDPFSLDGLSITIDSPIGFDDSPFFALWPLSLGSGSVPFTNVLFSVSVPASTPVGIYNGSVTMAGTDVTTGAPYPIGTLDFQVNVPAPEPGSLALLGLGACALAAVRRVRRARR